ncbi:inositol-3-phosphate synthase [Rhodococcus erythropolis]
MGLRSTNRDTLVGDEDGGRSWTTVFEGAARIADEIRDFAATSGVRDVLVLNLASPTRRVEMNQSNVTAEMLLQADSSEVPSAYTYMFGALQAGAHFIDFTPSCTRHGR